MNARTGSTIATNVMAIYETRGPIPPTTDLNQGDILRNVVRPTLVPATAVTRVLSRSKVEHPPDRTALGRKDGELRAISRLEYLDFAVVLSASCDNARGTLPLIFAPVRPFKFQRASPAEQWREISTAATGTASPKLFYLPSSPEHGISRSEAQLGDLFVLSHELVERCIREAGTTRACGLTSSAVLHLQWALSLMFGRNPRDDDDWPSIEDHQLHLSALEAEIAAATERHQTAQVATLEQRRARVVAIIGASRVGGAAVVSDTVAVPDVKDLQAGEQGAKAVRPMEPAAEGPPSPDNSDKAGTSDP